MKTLLVRWLAAFLVIVGLCYGAAVFAQAHYRATRISTNTTTVVKSGPGIFYSLIINTRGAAGNYLYVYDNTNIGATLIAVVDTTNVVGTLTYNVIVLTGITVFTASGTPGDVTVISD